MTYSLFKHGNKLVYVTINDISCSVLIGTPDDKEIYAMTSVEVNDVKWFRGHSTTLVHILTDQGLLILSGFPAISMAQWEYTVLKQLDFSHFQIFQKGENVEIHKINIPVAQSNWLTLQCALALFCLLGAVICILLLIYTNLTGATMDTRTALTILSVILSVISFVSFYAWIYPERTAEYPRDP